MIKMSNKLKVVYNNYTKGKNIKELINEDEIEDLIDEIETLPINELLQTLYWYDSVGLDD